MPFQIIHQDIAAFACDAIVCPTDPCFSGSGGADYAIHRAAGPELDAECAALPPLAVGEIAVTGAYALPCRNVFHTVGPVWNGGQDNEAALLRGCYLNALLRAKKLGLSSIAFPLISSGTFGFPKDRVLRIATDAVADFLFTADSEMFIYICILDRDSYALGKEFALEEYMGGGKSSAYRGRSVKPCREKKVRGVPEEQADFMSAPVCSSLPCPDAGPGNLADFIKKQDDSFAVMLLKLIDRKGMTDVECYKKANVSKGTFWKINNDPKYRPGKATVLAFAIALELDMDETSALLKTVGFSLSNSNTFDKIIQFYIMNGNYDIFEINAALYKYDQLCLGC